MTSVHVNDYPAKAGEGHPVVFVGTLKTAPASGYLTRSKLRDAVVMKRALKSGPPKVQLVTCGTGSSTRPRRSPCGLKQVIREPPQCASHTRFSLSTVRPSGNPSFFESSLANSLRLDIVPSGCFSKAHTVPPKVSTW